MTMVATSSPSIDGPDQLAGGVLSALQRRRKQGRIGGALRGLVGAAVTFGVWPIIKWPLRLRDLAATERHQFWHLYEWIRLQGGYPQADLEPLRRAVEKVRFRLSLWLVSLIAVVGVAAFFGWVGAPAGLSLRDYGLVTYGGGQLAGSVVPASIAWRMYLAWTIGMSLAYGLHWVAVQLHGRDVRRVARALNAITAREGLAAVKLPPVGVGIGLGWIAAAAVLWLFGACWGVPFALAGAAHQRLAERSVPRLREQMAETLRTMLLIRRPGMRIPTAVTLTRKCGNPQCGARVLQVANFCPRCGTRMDGTVNQVA